MINKEAKEWLDNNQLSIDIWSKKYQYANETFEEWLDRVSGGNEEIKRLIKEKKFLFGGRTLSNRGVPNSGSYSNCYSIGFVPDSLNDIMDTAHKIAMTFKAQGGQGLSLSKIRPKGSMIAGQFKSDGIVPFMNIFNTVTESVSQGGSRKGALLMSIDAWHPEAETFIKIKEDPNKINKANLSVEIDDNFMEYLEAGTEDNSPSGYANHLYDVICKSAWKSAEPGIIFTSRFRNYNLMEFVNDYQIETCNPCGEQPLPKHGACNLCSINVSEYVLDPWTNKARIDYISLKDDLEVIISEMDKVLEENLDRHALSEQKEMAKKYRNIGIGIMGLADLFVKMGVKYGSPDSIAIANTLMKFIFRESVIISAANGRIYGNFPGYSSEVWNSTIIKNAFSEEEIELLKKRDTLRNCSLLSIAPTGSIGTMFNISTGVEPFFALSYNRKTDNLNGTYKVDIKAVEEYRKVTGNKGELPNYFVTSEDIHWKDRIAVQAALQEYCDTAISSTINLPESTTVDDVKALYYEAWSKGLKGITVYRTGCNREGILTTNNTPKVVNTTVPKRPNKLEADCYGVKIKGEQFIVAVGLYDNKPYEIFAFKIAPYIKVPYHKGVITKVAKGQYSLESEYFSINNLVAEMGPEEQAVTLYCSMLLRHGVSMKYTIKTTKKVNNLVTSFSSAICRILSKYMGKETTDKCPECGGNLIYEAGCTHCDSCEFSKCE